MPDANGLAIDAPLAWPAKKGGAEINNKRARPLFFPVGIEAPKEFWTLNKDTGVVTIKAPAELQASAQKEIDLLIKANVVARHDLVTSVRNKNGEVVGYVSWALVLSVEGNQLVAKGYVKWNDLTK